MAAVAAAPARSNVGRAVNAVSVERHDGTDRHHDSQEPRRTFGSGEGWRFHGAMAYFPTDIYHGSRPVRTTPDPTTEGRRRDRTPARSAGLADHVRPPPEWI